MQVGLTASFTENGALASVSGCSIFLSVELGVAVISNAGARSISGSQEGSGEKV